MPNALMFITNECKRYAALPYVESGTNHQKFSDIVNAYGLNGCQNQAWCATYQFALELMAFGKADALAHWNMTNGYVGYSVFGTRDKFKAAGKTGSTPRLGALVIFKRSHMGRVIEIDEAKKTFRCGEGNTSNKEFNRDGNSCAIKTYSFADAGIDCFCYIDYGDWRLTREKVVKAYRAVYEMAHNLRWRYGDSHSVPPCIGDNTISCDRMISLAFWILGYTDQPAGGFTVSQKDGRYMEPYLVKWGLKKNTNANACKKGDVVIFRNSDPRPNELWHTFGLSEFTSVASVKKYDMGSQARIDSSQPFTAPLNQWEGQRWFYASFQIQEDTEAEPYMFKPVRILSGASGKSQYAVTRILKARGYRGVKKNGVEQELQLNDSFTKGDVAALVKYKWDRMINGKNLCTGILADEVNTTVYEDMFGMSLPIKCVNVPDKCRSGPLILWLQEVLRSEGFVGKDGNLIDLDQQWGENTEFAVKSYQKMYGFKETGKVTYSLWKHMCTNRSV